MGAYLIKYVNPIYLQMVVAIFLILNLPQLFISRKEQQKEEKPYPNFVLAIVGFLAGFVSGITGAIGLLFNRFYLRYGLSKEEIVATRAANEIFLHLIKIIIYVLLGLYSKSAFWLGIAIAVGAIISSYSVKYILPYLSEFVFRKVGYGAMVISGIILLVSTSQKIITQDKISVNTASFANKNEATLKWRTTDFSLEFAFDEGFEVERTIKPDELPANILAKYNELIKDYDKIYLEKVFKFDDDLLYEFYCYKNGKLTKFDFVED